MCNALTQVRQPWADVQLEPAVPTAEQLEWLEKEGFIVEEEEEEAGDDKDGDEPGTAAAKKRKVGPACMHACTS